MSRGATPPGTNAMFPYTNQAMEFQSPDDHKGEGTQLTETGSIVAGSVGECQAEDGIDPNNNQSSQNQVSIPVSAYRDAYGNCINYKNDNHRSLLPVIK